MIIEIFSLNYWCELCVHIIIERLGKLLIVSALSTFRPAWHVEIWIAEIILYNEIIWEEFYSFGKENEKRSREKRSSKLTKAVIVFNINLSFLKMTQIADLRNERIRWCNTEIFVTALYFCIFRVDPPMPRSLFHRKSAVNGIFSFCFFLLVLERRMLWRQDTRGS